MGGDATDTYTHSPAQNDTYLLIDDAYAEWYKDKYDEEITKWLLLPVYHILQGDPESGKMLMKIINKVIIDQLGFQTTTQNRCIYMRVRDSETQLMLWQVDDFYWLQSCKDQQETYLTTLRWK